jgi:hypothetical protein
LKDCYVLDLLLTRCGIEEEAEESKMTSRFWLELKN